MHPFFVSLIMVTIEKIHYKDGYVSIDIDGGESLKIPYDVYSMFKLESGCQISNEEYQQLLEESHRFMCKRKALDYLAIRTRSCQEMERYLAKKGFDMDFIRETVNLLKEKKYIDDFDYSLRYIRDRLNRKVIGKNLLISELTRRGIEKNTIKKALKSADADKVNPEEVYEIAAKKYETLKGKKNCLSKLSFFLYQRGFDHEIIADVIDRIRDSEDC